MAIALDYSLTVYEPLAQNHYPDFTLTKGTDDREKIAVDVKTTYRSIHPDGRWKAKFTLGACTSFMRDEKKNIAFPYTTYQKHCIVWSAPHSVDSGESQLLRVSYLNRLELNGR